jgi:Zn-dependent membrane protease YugP
MLNSAALTYVASLITTLLQILRLALIALGRRDD